MPKWFVAFEWSLGIAGTSPIWLGFGLSIWDDWIRPKLIPQHEIDRLADELIAFDADAEMTARINEDRAWRYCDGYEAAKWRRLRQAICRKMRQPE